MRKMLVYLGSCFLFLGTQVFAQERVVPFSIQRQKSVPITVEYRQNDRVLADTVSVGKNGYEGLSFLITNSSGKTIRHLSIEVDCVSNGEHYLYPFSYGPQTEVQKNRMNETPIKPGDRIEIKASKVNPEFFSKIGEFSEVVVGVGFVIFDDKTAWRGGMNLRQDENNPLRWIPVADRR